MKKIQILFFTISILLSQNIFCQNTDAENEKLFNQGKIDFYYNYKGHLISRDEIAKISLVFSKLGGEKAQKGLLSNPTRKSFLRDGNDFEISFIDTENQIHKIPKVFHLINAIEEKNNKFKPILYYENKVYYILINSNLDTDEYLTELITFKNDRFIFEKLDNLGQNQAFFGKKVNTFPSIYHISIASNNVKKTYRTIKLENGSFQTKPTNEDPDLYIKLKNDSSSPQFGFFDHNYYPFEINKDVLKYYEISSPYVPVYSEGDDLAASPSDPGTIHKVLDKYTIEIKNMPKVKNQGGFNTCVVYTLAALNQKNIYDEGNFKVPIEDLPDSLKIDYFALMTQVYTDEGKFYFRDLDPLLEIFKDNYIINSYQVGNCQNTNKMSEFLDAGYVNQIGNEALKKLGEDRRQYFYNFIRETFKNSLKYLTYNKEKEITEVKNWPPEELIKTKKEFTKATSLPADDFDFEGALSKYHYTEWTVSNYFKGLFFDKCKIVDKKSNIISIYSHPESNSVDSCINKIKDILLKSKCPVGVGGAVIPIDQRTNVLDLNNMVPFQNDNTMKHAVVVYGYRKVLNPQTGDTLELFKILNSWGPYWQKNCNDGWIDARNFILKHPLLTSRTARNITLLYIPLKRNYIESSDFLTHLKNTQAIISESMAKGYKFSIENYKRSPRLININIIYAKIDNEIKNKRWDAAYGLAKLYEYLIPFESGMPNEKALLSGFYVKIYNLMAYLETKKGKVIEAKALYKKAYEFLVDESYKFVNFNTFKNQSIPHIDSYLKESLELKLKLNIIEEDYNAFEKVDPATVEKIRRLASSYIRSESGHSCFDKYFELFVLKKTNQALTGTELMKSMCHHYGPEHYEDIMKYEDYIIKNKEIFKEKYSYQVYRNLAELYLHMQKRDPDFKTDKALLYINEAILLYKKEYGESYKSLEEIKALILCEHKKFKESLEIFKNENFQQFDDYAAFGYARGICYLNLGDKISARKDLEKVKNGLIKETYQAKWEFPVNLIEVELALERCK